MFILQEKKNGKANVNFQQGFNEQKSSSLVENCYLTLHDSRLPRLAGKFLNEKFSENEKSFAWCQLQGAG